jgi:hypothetical protein
MMHLASFDLEKLGYSRVLSVERNVLPLEQVNRLKIGVAGYRLLEAIKALGKPSSEDQYCQLILRIFC